MKLPIRFFSIGLLTSTLILLFVFILHEKQNSEINLSIDDLIKQIEDEGYHVLTKSEYISFSVNKDQTAENTKENNHQSDEVEQTKNETKDKDKDKDNDNEKVNESDKNKKDEADENDKKKEKEVHTYRLVVEPNMLGTEIADLLVEKKIIDDAVKFNRYLEVEGYAKYIQLGEFELTSEMTHYQIAEIIAKKR